MYSLHLPPQHLFQVELWVVVQVEQQVVQVEQQVAVLVALLHQDYLIT